MKKPPRNAPNYRIQELPDCCQNCALQYRIVDFFIGCSLACDDQKQVCVCDQVDPMGICDKYENGRIAHLSIILVKRLQVKDSVGVDQSGEVVGGA